MGGLIKIMSGKSTSSTGPGTTERRCSRPSIALTGIVGEKLGLQEDVSFAQVQSQIEALNRDFRAQNPELANLPDPWKPLVGDVGIEFALATEDPNGNATNGIDRRQTDVLSFSDDDAVKHVDRGGMDAWHSDRYLNLWVCSMQDFLGYAQFPGGPAATDGVVINYQAFGTLGTAAAPFALGRTATHEIGHWLNLLHIWGDDGTGCTGADNVDDTPNQSRTEHRLSRLSDGHVRQRAQW